MKGNNKLKTLFIPYLTLNIIFGIVLFIASCGEEKKPTDSDATSGSGGPGAGNGVVAYVELDYRPGFRSMGDALTFWELGGGGGGAGCDAAYEEPISVLASPGQQYDTFGSDSSSWTDDTYFPNLTLNNGDKVPFQRLGLIIKDSDGFHLMACEYDNDTDRDNPQPYTEGYTLGRSYREYGKCSFQRKVRPFGLVYMHTVSNFVEAQRDKLPELLRNKFTVDVNTTANIVGQHELFHQLGLWHHPVTDSIKYGESDALCHDSHYLSGEWKNASYFECECTLGETVKKFSEVTNEDELILATELFYRDGCLCEWHREKLMRFCNFGVLDGKM